MRSILSIDGGGIRGLIPLSCLVRLEAAQGKPAREIFDLIAGTSTGAIIAAGLALGVSARGLLALYRDLARRAFQRLPWWQVLLNLGNHRYSNAFIAQTLDALGADQPLNALPVDVLITGKNTRTSRTDFFVRDGPGNAHLWGRLPLRDAVLASVAAPTYFPAHSAALDGITHTWVDGGVGIAGNPCYHAAVEAVHYSGDRFTPGEIRLLSFGTGRLPHRIEAGRAHALAWARWVLAELMEDTGDWQTYVTRREYGLSGRIDFRRYQLDLSPEVLDMLGLALPLGIEPESFGLDAVWAVEWLEHIGRAFAARIDYDDTAGLDLRLGAGG